MLDRKDFHQGQIPEPGPHVKENISTLCIIPVKKFLDKINLLGKNGTLGWVNDEGMRDEKRGG